MKLRLLAGPGENGELVTHGYGDFPGFFGGKMGFHHWISGSPSFRESHLDQTFCCGAQPVGPVRAQIQSVSSMRPMKAVASEARLLVG